MVMPRVGARNSRGAAASPSLPGPVLGWSSELPGGAARGRSVRGPELTGRGRVGVVNSWAGARPGAAALRSSRLGRVRLPRGGQRGPGGRPPPRTEPHLGAPVTPPAPPSYRGLRLGRHALGNLLVSLGTLAGGLIDTGLGQPPPHRGRIRYPLALETCRVLAPRRGRRPGGRGAG